MYPNTYFKPGMFLCDGFLMNKSFQSQDSSSEDAEKKMDSKYTLVAMDTDHDVSVQSGFSAYKTPFFQWLPPQSHDRLRRSARRK